MTERRKQRLPSRKILVRCLIFFVIGIAILGYCILQFPLADSLPILRSHAEVRQAHHMEILVLLGVCCLYRAIADFNRSLRKVRKYGTDQHVPEVYFVCPQCGANIQDGDKQCRICGADLSR